MDLTRLAFRMIDYYVGDARRINHFVRVHGYARLIGLNENLDDRTQAILEAAALVHDIGIKPSEEKYGHCEGPLQEKEGPPVARAMLRELGFPDDVVERVCFLVGHHHTYTHIDGIDYRILVEADFLVNAIDSQLPPENIRSVKERIFRTASGIAILDLLTA